MGEHKVSEELGDEQRRTFTRALLDDVTALEKMLEDGLIETGVRRIGAEQEMFLIGEGGNPAPVAVEVLEHLDDPAFTTELARFNLEANLPPYDFGGDCLRRLHTDLDRMVGMARESARACNADVLLTGILPTLQLSDLGLENMTPVPRYMTLNNAVVKMRGGDFQIRIKGIDELYAEHDNVMLESCNTSFQIHFQTGPEEFARLYNLAQAVSAPVLAAAVNSPLLLDHRLWHETRVALFQHSVDDRSQTHQARGRKSRVRFGEKWVEESALEIFREDIARFRVVLATDVGEHPMQVLERGDIPELTALRLHNGTVYRWNRACYGVHEGKAHLRIENRVLPAGPTTIDEVANAAFFYGLMAALADEYGDITDVMTFDEAKANFIAAARLGMRAQLTWVGGQSSTASSLIIEHLLPLARQGLATHGIDSADIDEYLGIVEARAESEMTGAQWMLNSLAEMGEKGTPHDRCRALTRAIHARQVEKLPVHTWPLADPSKSGEWHHSYRTIGQFMTRDIFTVQPDDLVDLAANVMDWEHIRHVPVEDDEGRLVGLLSHRSLLRLLAHGKSAEQEPVAVRDLMEREPITVTADTPTMNAIAIMRGHDVGCLPVVDGDRLVGIITTADLFEVAAQVIQDQLEGLETS